ncbi:MAG: hypothetical protein IKZ19_09780 [Clostridia bacterium]|nr:hypothetical protein [Clostridia bacterium]
MIKFGNRPELFVDDYLIEKLDNVSFRLTQPTNLGQAISFDKPWEEPGSAVGTAFYDGKQIRLYYRGFPANIPEDESQFQTSCLAVSSDGVNFERVPVNKIDYFGIKENNIVKMDTFCHNFSPFYDTNPLCPENERFKAIAGIPAVGGLSVFVSEDGINWRDYVGHPVITRGDFDSMNTAFWDPEAELYRCYHRIFRYSPMTGKGVRTIQSCVSTDFIHWSKPVDNIYEERDTDELYTNATRPLPGAEHILVSIPMRFKNSRIVGDGYPKGSLGVSDAVLMTSRDGLHWDKTAREPWLSGSLYSHEWTQRCFITGPGVVEVGDNWIFYVSKNYMWDDDGIWAYSVPRHRLMSLFADNRGGTFTSKLVHFEQDFIHLNFSTSAYGSVKVKIIDANGELKFESDELFGNDISRRVHFDGLANTVGRIILEMNEANVYAIGSNMNKTN